MSFRASAHHLPIGLIATAAVALSLCPLAAQELEQADEDARESVDSLRFRDPLDPRRDTVGDPLPPHALLRLGTARFRHPSSVTEMALSPDEQTMITLGSGILAAWDLETGKQLWQRNWRNHGGHIIGSAYGQRFIAFGADSSSFYTTSNSNRVLVWDARKGTMDSLPFDLLEPQAIARPGHSSGFTSIDVKQDGSQFLVGTAGGITLCNRKGKSLWSLANRPENPVEIGGGSSDRLWFGRHFSTAIFCPDETQVAVVLSDNPQRILIVAAMSGERLQEIPLSENLVRMTFDADGKSIIATERDCAVRCYTVASGQRQWELIIPPAENAESYTSAVACSSDGGLVAVGAPIGASNLIYLLDGKTGKPLTELRGHSWKPWAVRFSADARLLYSTGWDGAIRRWDVARGEQLAPPKGLRGTGVVAASPSGDTMAFMDDEGLIHVLDVNDGNEQLGIEMEDARATIINYGPDGKLLVAGGAGESNVVVTSWDLATGEQLRSWRWPQGKDPHSDVQALAVSADAKLIAAAVFRQHAAYLWNQESGEQIAQLRHQQIYGLDMHPQSPRLATVGWDRFIRLWDGVSGELIDEIDVSQAINQEKRRANADLRMYGVCFAPDGRRMAAAHMDGSISVWNVHGPTQMQFADLFDAAPRATLCAITYSPDGLWLAAGSSNGVVTILDSRSGARMWDLVAHDERISTLGFSSSSRELVSGAGSLSYLWSIVPETNDGEHDLEAMWDQMGSDDHTAAYRSMWALEKQADRATAFIAKRLAEVETTFDLDAIAQGQRESAAARRKRLVQQTIARNSKVEALVRIHRAITVLKLIGTEGARSALKQLAEHHSHEPIRAYADQLR